MNIFLYICFVIMTIGVSINAILFSVQIIRIWRQLECQQLLLESIKTLLERQELYDNYE